MRRFYAIVIAALILLIGGNVSANMHEAHIEQLSAPLDGEKLTIGGTLRIGETINWDDKVPINCLQKKSWNSLFCIENVNWGNADAGLFNVRSALYNGRKAVVRYINKKLTGAYVLLPIDKFVDVLKMLQKNYGPPTERQIKWVSVMAAPKIANSIYRWKSLNDEGGVGDILEIRSIDDQRQTFADLRFASLRLYQAGQQPIFRQLSMSDVVIFNKRRLVPE